MPRHKRWDKVDFIKHLRRTVSEGQYDLLQRHAIGPCATSLRCLVLGASPRAGRLLLRTSMRSKGWKRPPLE